MSEEKTEAERVYPIRIAGPAADDVARAVEYLTGIAGKSYAAEWENGFYDKIRTLSTMPRRHSIVQPETQRFGFEVRKLLYQRPKSRITYYVFFQIQQEEDDPPFIRLLHIRHGSRRPITNKEVKALQSLLQEEHGSE